MTRDDAGTRALQERIADAVRREIGVAFPCANSKHDGVHSDMACWHCFGTMVSREGSALIEAIIAAVDAALFADGAA